MCGIIITRDGTEERIASIKHRGTEKSSIFMNDLLLCHHRLPIQTADHDEWNQPKEVSPGIYLMFNGEIFNYDTSQFASDIEYLCNLFGRYKGGSFEMFCSMFLPEIQTWDGFWAITIWDANTNDLIVFTDPLGKKCLYYNAMGEVCSEVKGLVYDNSTKDETLVSTIRKWGYNTDDRTMYSDIKRFIPNNIYSYNIDVPEFKNIYKEYYKGFDVPIAELIGADYETHMEWLWGKMFEAVKNRLVSKDYPISLLISGGLDSSIIAAILHQMKADVRWFSIENGEREYVELLSKYLDTEVSFLDYHFYIYFSDYCFPVFAVEL